MSDIDLDHPTRGIDWRRTPGPQVRSRLVLLADAVKAAEAERDAYREMLVEALDEYVDHQSWRCGHPPHYYLVERSEQGYEGCPCGLDEFCKRARSVLAGVVSTREKDK